ncbi:MAG: glycosyltransferase family 4 protein [Acidimicrobiales bacterium]|jgi:glycosyltransferase involved in cell wall biosynthesis
MGVIAGGIDRPDGAAEVDPAELFVDGWAYARSSPVERVDLWLDEHWLGRAWQDRSRPDVAQALEDANAERSGFSFRVTAPPVRDGQPAMLRAAVTLVDGTQEWWQPTVVRFQSRSDLPATDDRSRPLLKGGIDLPQAGDVLDSRELQVWGWAFDHSSLVARVDVWLDARHLGRAGLGRPRPDVAAALGEPDAELSGFELLAVVPPTLAAGNLATLGATVTLLDGRHEELAPVTVRIQSVPELPPVAVTATRGSGVRVRSGTGRGGTIRVLWSARGLDQGGSELRMVEVVEDLARVGGFHSTVMSAEEGPLRTALESAGATVSIVPRVPFHDIRSYEQWLSQVDEWMDGRFDMVIGATVSSFPVVDLAARVGLPSVLQIGEAEPLGTVASWLFGRLDPEVEQCARRAFAGATAILSNSNAAVTTYRADGYAGRFVVIGTGVDVAGARTYTAGSSRDDCRRRLGIDPHERLLVCAGSLWRVKGQAVLVAALERVRREHPLLTCALVGLAPEGPYAEAIASFIGRHGMTGAVRMLPFQDDLRPWWLAADLVVCPSESEALPAAVLEAMAFGKPVICCRVGDLPELVEPGVTGWLCDRSDLGAMIVGLEEAARAPTESLQAMGAAAAEKAARSYDRVEVLERTIRLFRDVAGGAPPC